jgi:hypothetical protein
MGDGILMRCTTFAVIVVLALPCVARAQAIPSSVREAEAEGRQFSRDSLNATQALFTTQVYSGTAERRCIDRSATNDRSGALQFRSGDFIMRAAWSRRSGAADKMLWLPAHGAAHPAAPLLIRAARIGNPADSLRKIIAGPAHSHGGIGYPSSVEFSAPGDWVVVVTAAQDWGCFLFTVAQ